MTTLFEARHNASHAKFNPRRWAPHEDYAEMVWFSPHGDYAQIQCNTTIGRWHSSYKDLKHAYDAWVKWMGTVNSGAPASAGTGFFSSPENQGDGAWVFMDTQEMLVSGAIFGIAASAVVAFSVLSISTCNPYIAMLSSESSKSA